VLVLAFGKKKWHQIESEAVDAVADWMRYGMRSAFRRRYRRHVLFLYSTFNLRGIGLITAYKLNLQEIFVEPRVEIYDQHQSNDLIPQRSQSRDLLVWDFLRTRSIPEGSAVMILGPPGCGKTTLLQQIAVTLAMNRQNRYGVRAHTPILLRLHDHAANILREQPPSLGNLTEDYFDDVNLFPSLKLPHGWFEHELRRGACIVLLDGLDDIANSEDRGRVSAWVDAQIARYPRCRFVVTALKDTGMLLSRVLSSSRSSHSTRNRCSSSLRIGT
jgi:hypothetical protein